MASFTEVPILDLSLSRSPKTKPQFLEDLKRALLEVGFLYIKNYGIDEKLTEEVIRLGKLFFELPEEEKLRLEMRNSPHFLGYSRLGNEITSHATDWREQIDLATELPAPSPSEPRYRSLRGPNQWPSETLIPGFRETFDRYITLMGELSSEFTSLVAEAIGLPRDAFEKYYHGIGESRSGTKRQDKLKIVKYPDLGELGGGSNQGVGPHKDSMLSSYLLQASPHHSLQVQNSSGDWIPCPPIAGTLVVALGQGLEAITGGVVTSTTHRVLSPEAGEGPRFSIPFFQGISYDAEFEQMDVPEDVRRLKKEVLKSSARNEEKEVEMTFRKDLFGRLGEATLWNRVKSHTDVGERFYPDLLAEVRKKNAELAAASDNLSTGGEHPVQGRRRAPTIVLDRVDSSPSFGEDPGPDGSFERKEAFEKRKMDSTPDETRVREETGVF
ncbi:Clavaminate synthase-like protein [Ascodesmis nigricans]|uniref:Clavaminate synthase-like protein n=1 Tax=Ascodesmis nigricans TaxID=341454 RepID=A0A4S2N2V3_9PEZI|nr:Clavaminate synthase-like protein [Ascodesmis nigricans]